MAIGKWIGARIDSFTKQDDIDKLQKKAERLISEFEEETSHVINRINQKVDEFNSYIHLINGIRHDDIGPLIKQLFLFLNRIGNVENQSTPFDLKLESTSREVHITDNISSEYLSLIKKLEEEKNKWLNGSILKLYMDRKSNKEKILEGEKDIAQLDLALMHEKNKLNQKHKQIEEAIRVSDIYRVCVQTVIENIKGSIIPELAAVKAFLLAENIKNSIIASNKVHTVELEPISMMANTIYHRHYMFIQNVFLYYTIIVEFFKKPILTNILEDDKELEGERIIIEDQIKAIHAQFDRVKGYLSY